MLKKTFLKKFDIYALTVIIFSFSVNFFYSHIGVNPMDNFVLYNGGYRILNGYIPFKDYWLVTGPLLDYLNSFFFITFGISWKSFVLHSSLFNSLIAVLTYFFLLEFRLSKANSFLYSSSFALLMYPIVGTPFVDHHSTIFVILSFYSLILGIKNNSYFSLFIIPFLLCLGFLSKQTPTGYALVVISFIIITFCVFNIKKFKILFFPLLYGFIFSIIFLILFFYLTKIPLDSFWLQYFLYAKNVGEQRLLTMTISFKSIFFQYKFIYIPLAFLFLSLGATLKNFKKKNENFFIIISIISLSLLLIFHQILTSNQAYIFFLIPLLTAFVHIYYKSVFNKNNILLYLIIGICIFSVTKYHYRFNEQRKFNELENIDIRKSVNAGQIHSSLSGLRWITIDYPEKPSEEIEAINDSIDIIRNDNRRKSLITSYQFIAPSLLIYDYSPNQWHHASVSFPIKGQKYYEAYKKFFINNLKKNKIDVIYSIGKAEKGVVSLILTNNCFETKKEGKIIFSHTLLKQCKDFQ